MPRFRTQSWLALVLSIVSAVVNAAPDGLTYFHVDNVGSPIAATDAYGNVTWRENYLPHGEKRAFELSSGNNQQWFTGHFHDDDTKLTYMGARHYDPVLGRFLSIDPASFDPGDPFTFNRYAYANNNPYLYVDPNGESAIAGGIIVLGVIVVAGTAAVCESCRQGMVDAFTPLVSSALDGLRSVVSGGAGSTVAPSDMTGTASPPPPEDDDFAPSDIRFGQSNVGSTFSHGPFKGMSTGEVAAGLRAGRISPDQLPINVIVRNGEPITLNNRSLLALRRAGQQPTQIVNRTGQAEWEANLDWHVSGKPPSFWIRIRGIRGDGPASLID